MAQPARATRKTRPASDRRARIVEALDRCIRTTGVAAISLTEIAAAAEMSLSHLRYYFESKDEVIEYYLQSLSDEILRDIEAIERRTPEQWLEDFVAFYVANPKLTSTSVGVVIEIFGVSVHNKALARVKNRHDAAIRDTLRSYFDWAGTAGGMTVDEAAYTAWCLEAGMKFNAAFQEDFSSERAGAIFLAEMRRMSGAPPSRPKAGARPRRLPAPGPPQ
jgi:AcrR family transcriptional regulator